MTKIKNNKKKGTALYLGKFQPFHKDHLKMVKHILKEYQRIKIAVGSSEKHHEKKNPFAYHERKQMIDAALQEAGISKKRYMIIAVPDIYDDEKYVVHVKKCTGPFRVTYTGYWLNIELFRKAGCKVKAIKRFSDISATKIRKSIREGTNNYKKMIPKSVRRIMGKINAKKRLQDILK